MKEDAYRIHLQESPFWAVTSSTGWPRALREKVHSCAARTRAPGLALPSRGGLFPPARPRGSPALCAQSPRNSEPSNPLRKGPGGSGRPSVLADAGEAAKGTEVKANSVSSDLPRSRQVRSPCGALSGCTGGAPTRGSPGE